MSRNWYAGVVLSLIAAVALAGGPPDSCDAAAPPPLKQQLEREYADHRFPHESDNLAEDIEYSVKSGGGRCLAVSWADFDGNGLRDAVILLTPKAGKPPIVVAALRKTSGRFHTEVLRVWEGTDRERLYVAVLKTGHFERTGAVEAPFESGEVQSLSSDLPGVATGQTESTEIGYFYRQGRWLHVWIAD